MTIERDIPKSITENILTIMGVEIKVHVLDDGRRIIEGDGIERIFDMAFDGRELSDEDITNLAKLVQYPPTDE